MKLRQHPRLRPSRPCTRRSCFSWSLWLAADLLSGRIIRILTTIGRSNCLGGCCWCGGPHGLGLGRMDDEAFRYPLGNILGILGEVGLVLLFVQAGLAMDLHVLQQVGMRAIVISWHCSDRSCRPSLVPSWPTRVDIFTAALASHGLLVRSDQCRYCPKCVAAVWCHRHSVGSTHCGPLPLSTTVSPWSSCRCSRP
jgi:hypothetical protein